MQAFIAVLLVAAVSGQMTSGVDRNVFDYIKYRQMYPQVQGEMKHQLPSMFNYIDNQQQLTTGVFGDLVKSVIPTSYLPFNKQYNVPSVLYTLRQLYTIPEFQEYLTLPIFRQFLTTPAFQLYLTSAEFQKFFTQQIFRQFFVDPVLFYKYIYPVVQQYQVQVQQQQYQGQYVNGQQLINTIVPETTSYYPRGLETLFGQGSVLPTTQNMYTNMLYKNLINKNLNMNLINKNLDLNMNVLPQVYTKNVLPEMYNTELYNLVNKYESVYPKYDTTVYGYGKQTMLNKNILDVLTNQKQIFPFGLDTQKTFVPTFTNTFGLDTQKTFVPTFTNTFGLDTQKTIVPTFTNTFGAGVVKTQELYLEKIIKDLVQGKITIDDLTKTNFVNEKINKIVDPITGEIKIVDEKIVKPLDITFEQEMNKEALIKLNKVLLNKAIFNKL